eukprot:1595140-Pyramimonas_sp.AAC.1
MSYANCVMTWSALSVAAFLLFVRQWCSRLITASARVKIFLAWGQVGIYHSPFWDVFAQPGGGYPRMFFRFSRGRDS